MGRLKSYDLRGNKMGDSSNPFVNGELPETYISAGKVREIVPSGTRKVLAIPSEPTDELRWAVHKATRQANLHPRYIDQILIAVLAKLRGESND